MVGIKEHLKIGFHLLRLIWWQNMGFISIDWLVVLLKKRSFQLLGIIVNLIHFKVVEIRPVGIDKGSSALYFLSKDYFDFILAIGDDITDEDLFKALPEYAYTII